MSNYIDLEKNQKFLKLVYYMRENYSNANLNNLRHLDKFFTYKVDAYYNKETNSYVFKTATKTIPMHFDATKLRLGRNQIFSEKQKKNICDYYKTHNVSKRKLAQICKCSEATIRRILKKY